MQTLYTITYVSSLVQMYKIETIISENGNNKEDLCKLMKTKLSKSFEYLTHKLKKIPNKNYLEESVKEWVDEQMPN